jgi:hypothetical protein
MEPALSEANVFEMTGLTSPCPLLIKERENKKNPIVASVLDSRIRGNDILRTVENKKSHRRAMGFMD